MKIIYFALLVVLFLAVASPAEADSSYRWWRRRRSKSRGFWGRLKGKKKKNEGKLPVKKTMGKNDEEVRRLKAELQVKISEIKKRDDEIKRLGAQLKLREVAQNCKSETKKRDDEIQSLRMQLNTRLVVQNGKVGQPAMNQCKKWGKFEKMCKKAINYGISTQQSQKFSFTCQTTNGKQQQCDLFLLYLKYLWKNGKVVSKDNFYYSFKGNGCLDRGNNRPDEVLAKCTVLDNTLIKFAEACDDTAGVHSCNSPDYRMGLLVDKYQSKSSWRRHLLVENAKSSQC